MALLQYGYEYGVYCYRCGVTGPGYETEEAAIAAWNKRVETKEK
jgi:hypothetical protein